MLCRMQCCSPSLCGFAQRPHGVDHLHRATNPHPALDLTHRHNSQLIFPLSKLPRGRRTALHAIPCSTVLLPLCGSDSHSHGREINCELKQLQVEGEGLLAPPETGACVKCPSCHSFTTPLAVGNKRNDFLDNQPCGRP